MSDDELRRTLEAAGQAEVPTPDPAFVRDLEARLAGGTAVSPMPHRRPLLPAAAAVLVIAGGIGLAIGLSHDEGPSDQVRTEPNPSVTTSTVLDAPTTTSLLPPVTPSTVLSTSSTSPTSTTSTTSPRSAGTASTTTVPRPTTTLAPTTTAPPASQDLHLTCSTDPVNRRVRCGWDASTNPAFATYRLTRRTHDGPENVVYTGTAREFSEPSGVGARWVYAVTALDAAGKVLGTGSAEITCC